MGTAITNIIGPGLRVEGYWHPALLACTYCTALYDIDVWGWSGTTISVLLLKVELLQFQKRLEKVFAVAKKRQKCHLLDRLRARVNGRRHSCSTLESNPKQITLYRKTQSLSRLQLNLIPEE